MPNGPIYRFENIGPIASAGLELGDLTIVAGRNNTGKTRLVHALYGFLAGWPHVDRYGPAVPGYSSPVFDRLVDSLAERGEASIPMNRKTLAGERKTILRQICKVFSDFGFADVFNAPEDDFSETRLEIDLASPAPECSVSKDFPAPRTGAAAIRCDGKTIDAILDTGQPPPGGDSTRFRMALAKAYISFLFPEFPMRPFPLASERHGISLFYKDLDRNRSDIVDALRKARRDERTNIAGLPDFADSASGRCSLPVRDNTVFARDITRLPETRGGARGRKLSGNIGKMLRGAYRVANDDIQFVPESPDGDDIALPLYRASSSVRELSDFYFFLRRAADRYDLLVIDEPESHLDTANQIRMARLLVRAVNTGLKVLITTHSDYIIKELNNLIMLNSLDDTFLEKHGYRTGDRLDPGRIRAYVAGNNSLAESRIDEFGVEMPVFDNTINDINYVANDLAAWLEARSHD